LGTNYLVGIPKGKIIYGRTRRRWGDDTRTGLEDVVCEDMGVTGSC
jgi:hypothetical protein